MPRPKSPSPNPWIIALRRSGKAAIFLFFVFALVLTIPIGSDRFTAETKPTPTYEEAVHAIQSELASPQPGVRPDCATRLMEHGAPTEHVFVLLHGLCNCPRQFEEFGKLLYERGNNVLIPRLPFHGLENRMNTEVAKLTAWDMLAGANQAADLAHGLGRNVTVIGLSINGTVVAWMAQNRDDIHRAVLLTPFLVPAMIPTWAAGPAERLMGRLPNAFIWWDDKQKENLAGPDYAYPRFSTRVISEVMRLGSSVLEESETRPPASRSILVVTTAGDGASNPDATADLVKNWRRLAPKAVTTYEFPAGDHVPHDLIDPNQPDQKISLVYPKLLELVDPPAAKKSTTPDLPVMR